MNVHLVSRLERGMTLPGARWLSEAWNAWMSDTLARPIPTPHGARLVTVGGATLGGSGKTPLAIALARAMARRGRRVVLVGHAYRAKPGRARIVRPDDDVRAVGDEALVAARALADTQAEVVVAERRADAVRFAAEHASLLILDGPLQAKPQRAFRALLAVDSARPWGSGRCPPLGDLRADPAALVAACDAVVAVGRHPPGPELFHRPVVHWPLVIEEFVAPSGERLPPSAFRHLRVGLLLGIARPERFESELRDEGIVPVCTLRFADHDVPSERLLRKTAMLAKKERLDAWIATEKCQTRLPSHVGNVPVVVAKRTLDISDEALSAFGIG